MLLTPFFGEPFLKIFMRQKANCFNFSFLFSLFMFNKFFFISITTPLRTIYHIIQCFLVGMCMGDLFTMPLFALAHFYAL